MTSNSAITSPIVLKDEVLLTQGSARVLPMVIWVFVCAALLGNSLTLFALLKGSLKAPSHGVFCLFQSKLTSRQSGSFSTREFQSLRTSLGGRLAIVAYSNIPLHVEINGRIIGALGSFVTPSYLAQSGSAFLLGSDIECSGSDYCREAVISRELWASQFSSNSGVIGHIITINSQDFRIKGVTADREFAPRSENPSLWISYNDEPALVGMDWLALDSKARWLNVVIRSRSNSSRTELENLIHHNYKSSAGDLLLLSGQEVRLISKARFRGPLVASLGVKSVSIGYTAIVFAVILSVFLLTRFVSTAWTFWPFLIASLSIIPLALIVYAFLNLALSYYLHLFQSSTASFSMQLETAAIAWMAGLLCGLLLIVRLIAKYQEKNKVSEKISYLDLGARIIRHRFLLLSGFLFASAAGYWNNGLFVSDFWEHAAVVRELATHLVHPVNPILPLPTTHAGYTPYGLLLGLFSRLTQISAVNTLAIAGLFNVCLLTFSLGLFVRRKLKTSGADFYALLFMLTLWGFFPWMMSGFLHFSLAIQTTSYPSFFATAVLLMAWYLQTLLLEGKSRLLFLPLLFSTTLVVIDHPITAISMFVGLFALCVDSRSQFRSLGLLVLTFVLSVSCALAWPYYSFARLLTHNSNSFDSATGGLYPGIGLFVGMTCFALFGLPALIGRFRRNTRDFLVVLFACSTLLYIGGWASGKLTLGRILFFIIFSLQLALADWLAQISDSSLLRNRSREGLWRLTTVRAVSILAIFSAAPGGLTALPIFQNTFDEYTFLYSYVHQYDLVLADTRSALKVPALNGKVAGYQPEHVLFFVNSADRDEAVARFFSPLIDDGQRRRILAQIHPEYVLINKAHVENWPDIVASLKDSVFTRYVDGDIMLFQVKSI